MPARPRNHRVSPLIHDPEAARAARLRAGLTVTAAAEGLGISKSFLAEIERGTRSMLRRPHLMREMADLYRCPVTEIERRRDIA